MRYSDYKCFRFEFDPGVVIISIDHPPINLLDEVLSQEFDKLGRELEADATRRRGHFRPHQLRRVSGFTA